MKVANESCLFEEVIEENYLVKSDKDSSQRWPIGLSRSHKKPTDRFSSHEILASAVLFDRSPFISGPIFHGQQMDLTPESQVRGMYTQSPMPLEHRLYLWNVTNKEEVVAGGE